MDSVRPGAVHDLCAIVIGGREQRRIDAALAGVLASARGLELDLVVVEGHGFAEACNRGLERSSSRYALFFDTDVALAEGSLQSLVFALDAQPEVGLAGVRELLPDGTVAPTIRRFPRPYHLIAEALGLAALPGLRRLLGERRFGACAYERQTACDWTAGSLLVARRTALEVAGWFDERLVPDAARADLCWRLRRTGWQVIHSPGLTATRGAAAARAAEAEKAFAQMQFVRKHLPLAVGSHRRALLFRYGVRIGAEAVLGRRTAGARAALGTVLRGTAPLGGSSALE